MKKTILFGAFFVILCFENAIAQSSAALEVYQIFKAKCNSCHDHASPAGNLDLEGTGGSDDAKAIFVANLLKNNAVTNATAAAKGMKNIYPGRPDRSFLFKKINETFEPTIPALTANEGDKMPNLIYTSAQLTEIEKEMIRQWIVFGAPNTGWPFDKQMVLDFYAGNGLKSYPDGPPPAPAPSEGFQIKVGPFFMKPDTEVEYYQKWELNLPVDVEVNRIDVKISNYSHHYLIYNWTDAATTIQHGLRTNAFHNNINLVAALQEATDLKLPATTAFKWSKNIILDLNTHYINYSLDKIYQAEAYINIYTQPIGTAVQEMHATLVPNVFVAPIPPNGQPFSKSATYNTAFPSEIYMWGLMGHTHKWGTSYKVWQRNSDGTKGEFLYDAACGGGVTNCASPIYDYQHIPMRYWLPLKNVHIKDGLTHEASWKNESPNPVYWGVTSDDEMMVMIAFWTLFPITVGTQTPDSQPFMVKIYPNPTSDRLVIGSNQVKKIDVFRLIDFSGKEVLRLENLIKSETEISVKNLPHGIYVWQADGQSGKLVVN
jgi:Secretion system C-terminal sorting domain